MRRILLRRNDEVLDITDKNFVLYGAGKEMFDLVENFGIRNIFKIIDRRAQELVEKNRWVQLYNLHFEVLPPCELLKLNPAGYIILITSLQYEQEIRQNIETILGKNTDFIICTRREICLEYDCIEELLYQDPVIKQKICNGNLSFEVKNIVSKFNEVISNLNLSEEKGGFSSVRGGNQKLLFTFGRTHRYIFSVPFFYNMSGMYYNSYVNQLNHDIEIKRRTYRVRHNYGIGEELTLYEDEDGYLLQYYGDEAIDFKSERVIAQVMNKLRLLHSCKINHLRYFDVLNAFKTNIMIAEKRYPELQDVLNIMKNSSEFLVTLGGAERQSKTTCHGDLFFTNIVRYKGNIVFIDWDQFCLSDPYYDVGRFLYSIYGFSEEKIADFYKGVSLYTQKKNNDFLVGRCLALIVLNQWRQLLFTYLKPANEINAEIEKIKIIEAVKMTNVVKHAM